MSINQLIVRNLKKNIKNYYLYVFALVFSIALYFAFVTLQYDPEMDPATGSLRGEAAVRAASVLLIAIVTIFLLYANQLFMKRRSKEFGLFQLIGMTKGRIFRIVSIENFLLYTCSLAVGIFIGFAVSKLITMTLFRITGVESVAELNFSLQAFWQTLLVFAVIYGVISLINYFYLRKQSILSLFQVQTKTEDKVKKVSWFEIGYGILGIVLISAGYYVSGRMFSGDFASINGLFGTMLFILASVILGTYLFYKGSVRWAGHLLRKKKQGYLNVNEVLSLSSVLFRMKSNAFLLTVITTVSALAIGLLSLSYISYYSAEKSAERGVAADFAFTDEETATSFQENLDERQIGYETNQVDVLIFDVNVSNLITNDFEALTFDPTQMTMPVVSAKDTGAVDVAENEVVFTETNDIIKKLTGMKDSGEVVLEGENFNLPLEMTSMSDLSVINSAFSFGLPTAIVSEKTFSQISDGSDPSLQRPYDQHIGVEITDANQIEEANTIFKSLENDQYPQMSKLADERAQKQNMGLAMFIVGFLGLAFLVTSGCVLYFKQMDEGEDEKPSYEILRKLGFTKGDLLRGIQGKQAFNFGIPLLVGLLHSYFVVQSGWFLFGTELWTPMLIVMVIYTLLYSLFGILSFFYYRKLIHRAL
ncbi:ABC transporter permease [Halobacillus fulvus]|nr:ABC transporter permease [Halobacillus fulvus]